MLELRNYLLKPNSREKFIEYFANHFVDSQKALGGYVLGRFTVKDEPDKFFWMRGFEDMRTRVAFLREFYEKGEVWKKYGSGANQMMLDSDNVYLLRPLESESFDKNTLAVEKGIVVIDFYFVAESRRNELAGSFLTHYTPFLKNKPTLWTSEMSENDFPRLPVVQDRNLLVAITAYKDESEYQSERLETVELKKPLRKLLQKENTLILFPTARSLSGSSFPAVREDCSKKNPA